jgi:hypothetical protein
MRTRLVAGPEAGDGGEVVVSLTEFRARRARDLPPIARDGLALARGWRALDGAIGVVLYVDASTKSGGSLSLWRDEDALRRFVGPPRHVAIMRRYRDRVTVRAATWTVAAAARDVDLDATLADRGARLAR